MCGGGLAVPDSRGRFVGVQSVPWAVSVDDTPADGKRQDVKRYSPHASMLSTGYPRLKKYQHSFYFCTQSVTSL